MLIGLSLYGFGLLAWLIADRYLTHTVPRHCQGVDIYAQPSDDSWGSERGAFSESCLVFRLISVIKANILIDHEGHARLADFGLLAIVSDPGHPTTSGSYTKAGTTRWMSPELLNPEQFGFKDSRPTKESDCYALGMVIYEVLIGHPPFKSYKDFTVMQKVIKGARPGRPEGTEAAWFTDDLWETLGLCWSPQPKNRPTIKAVIECLKRVSTTWRSLPPSVYGDEETYTDDESFSTISSPGMFPPDFVANSGLTLKGKFWDLGRLPLLRCRQPRQRPVHLYGGLLKCLLWEVQTLTRYLLTLGRRRKNSRGLSIGWVIRAFFTEFLY